MTPVPTHPSWPCLAPGVDAGDGDAPAHALDSHTMRIDEVMQKCLHDALGSMHALRSRVLLRAIEATIHGRRLTRWTWHARGQASSACAPLEGANRLPGNRHLHAERGYI